MLPASNTPPAPKKPISDSLDRHLTETIAKIPAGGKGTLQADVTTTGARIEVASKLRGPFVVGGWAGLAWGGQVEAGARIKATW